MRKYNNNFKRNRLFFVTVMLGLVMLGCSSGKSSAAAGYTVTVSKATISGTKEKYTFKYYLDGVLDSGFACYCQASGGITQWVGGAIDSCSGTSAVSKAISVSGVGVTANACCKPQPSVNSSLPQPPVNPGASCW